MLLANIHICSVYLYRAADPDRGGNQRGAVCLTVLGNMILLPLRFGVLGSAMAALITSTVVFIVYVHFNKRFYPIPRLATHQGLRLLWLRPSGRGTI